MNKDKLIKKLLKRADIVEDCDIGEEDFIDLPLEDFFNIDKPVVFNQAKSEFYKKSGEKWYRYQNRETKMYEQNDFLPLDKIESRIDSLYAWCPQFKKYADDNFALIREDVKKLTARIIRLEVQQEEFFKEIKEYVDLKTKPVTEKTAPKESPKKKVTKNAKSDDQPKTG